TRTVTKLARPTPEVISVRSNNPPLFYGAFPPAYPPYYPYPPGYFAAGAFTFMAGAAVGAALWGDCNWHGGGGDVNINSSRANNFTQNVNNTQTARNRMEQRPASGSGGRGDGGKWQHNPEHRKGVQYRDNATQQRFDKRGPANAQSREAFRGRSGQGSEPGRGGQQGGFGQAGARDRQGGFGQQPGGGGLGGRGGGEGWGGRGARALPCAG